MIPPLGLKRAKIQEDGLPKARPIDFRPSPFFHRSQSSAPFSRRYLTKSL
jgi:hypothetical protein